MSEPAQAIQPSGDQSAPLLCTVRETCQKLRVSEASVYRWLADGTLDSVKIGKSRRIKYASIVRLAESGAA